MVLPGIYLIVFRSAMNYEQLYPNLSLIEKWMTLPV